MKTKNISLFLFLLVSPIQISCQKRTITWGFSQREGNRGYQEDMYDAKQNSKGSFFGVYDGHDGDDVSFLAAQKLYTYFNQHTGSIQSKFEHAYLQVEKKSEECDRGGSTAVNVFVDNNTAHFGWSGDSRAVIYNSNNSIIYATKDHNFENKKEVTRIKNAGGSFFYDEHGDKRCNRLNMARTLGDHDEKKPKGAIIATPEYHKTPLSKEPYTVVLGSDGLWDELSNEQVGNILTKYFKKKYPQKEQFTEKKSRFNCPIECSLKASCEYELQDGSKHLRTLARSIRDRAFYNANKIHNIEADNISVLVVRIAAIKNDPNLFKRMLSNISLINQALFPYLHYKLGQYFETNQNSAHF